MLTIIVLISGFVLTGIIIRFSWIFIPLFRVLLACVLIVLSVYSFTLIFNDFYECRFPNTELKMRDGEMYYHNNKNTDIIIKKNYIFHIYSLNIPPYAGYTVKDDNIYRMTMGREVLFKLILILPFIFFILLALMEKKYYRIHLSGWNLMKHNEKMYIHHSIAVMIKELKEEIESLRNRKEDFIRVENQLNKLSDRVNEEEHIDTINKMKDDMNIMKEEFYANTVFGEKMRKCSDFAQESILRLDYGDIDIAVSVFNRGLKRDLESRFERKGDVRDFIKMAHQGHIIDYDMMYDLNWIVNLRADLSRVKKDIYPDISRMRNTINNYRNNVILKDNKEERGDI